MSFDKLQNCPRCGNIYVYTFKPYCQECVKKVERDFQLCAQFLRKRESRSSTMEEMSQQTGVSMSQITDFIREKRLLIDHHPNLGYACGSCGQTIRTGQVCDSCANEWKKTLTSLDVGNSGTEGEKRSAGYLNKDIFK